MIRRILVIHWGAIGDFVLSMPAIRLLRNRFPGAGIEIIGRPSIAALALDGRHADAVHDSERPHLSRLFIPRGEIPPDLAAFLAPFDVAVAFVGDPEGVLARNLERVGIGRVVTVPALPAPGSGIHAADHVVSGLAPLGISVFPAPAPEILPPAPWIEAADEMLATCGISHPLVVVHPGSGSRRKNWPPEAFARSLEELGPPEDVGLLVTRGEADSDEAVRLVQAARRRRAAILDSPPLATLAGILSHARLFLGNDSGITHLAAAVGTPTAAVFGPTDPAVWGPRGRCVRLLRGRALPDGGGVSQGNPAPADVAAAARACMEAARRSFLGRDRCATLPPKPAKEDPDE